MRSKETTTLSQGVRALATLLLPDSYEAKTTKLVCQAHQCKDHQTCVPGASSALTQLHIKHALPHEHSQHAVGMFYRHLHAFACDTPKKPQYNEAHELSNNPSNKGHDQRSTGTGGLKGCTHTHTHARTLMQTHEHSRTQTCAHANSYAQTRKSTHTHTHTRTRTPRTL